MSEQTRKRRRGRLLVAFVQTKDFALRIDIEAAKASPELHAMFERMQESVADIYNSHPRKRSARPEKDASHV